MKFIVQTDNLSMIKEAAGSDCDGLRFGPEFCEWKIPSLSELEKAYELASEGGKDFTYVTPRVSEGSLKKIRENLDFLNGKGKIEIVINDLGVLNILGSYPELRPHLGRELVYAPARCPWLSMGSRELGRNPLLISWKIRMRNVEKLYSQTSLNYAPTIRFFKGYGVQGIDVDWIDRCFPYYVFLVKNGLNLSVYLHMVPVTLTRKCHTARFLGERAPESCTKPCDTRAFLLKHEGGLEFFLHGNVVFRPVQPTQGDTRRLVKSGVTEFVVAMNPIMKISSQQKIDELIRRMR